jgi:Holliday junction DNA helicase RuvA
MFAKLTGIVDWVENDSLILDVNGVGYHVFASARTLSQLGGTGARVSLMIETQVREDHIHLFGFSSREERDWFRMLTTVQGVGAKAGLSILSACPPERLMIVIASGDAQSLRAADGVGPKLATRIVTELKDRVGNLVLGNAQAKLVPVAKQKNSKADEQAVITSIDPDVISALINLGYARSDAFQAVMSAKTKANDNEQNDLSAMIRLALKELSQ